MRFALVFLLSVGVCFGVWPQPAVMKVDSSSPSVICSSNLQFQPQASPAALPLLNKAIARYQKIIFARGNPECPPSPSQIIVKVSVQNTNSPVLNGQTDESYNVSFSSGRVAVVSPTVFGAMRALETIAQLVDRVTNTSRWTLPGAGMVSDAPRFSFRGFLHDSSRHFLTVKTLEILVDALAASKFNVLHWHITDDQSCPYVSQSLPLLSRGSWGGLTSHTYSADDVSHVVNYAYERGVRVVPEFDSPGHVGSFGVGYPQLVTQCYQNGSPNGQTGPIDPTKSSSFDIMSKLWNEVAKVFPDDYVHLGGDEVSYDCWQSNPQIQKWMAQRNWTNYELLEQYYEQNLIDIVQKTGKKYVVWQEIFDNGLKIDPRTIVDVWKNNPWKDEMARVTAAGYSAILSAPWYLNYVGDPYDNDGDWLQYYNVDPLDFDGTDEQKKLVIGGEGCMWGEYTSDSNVVSRTWPRAAAVGERLWSPNSVIDPSGAVSRISDFACELIRRGINAEPVTGPGYCLYEFDRTK